MSIKTKIKKFICGIVCPKNDLPVLKIDPAVTVPQISEVQAKEQKHPIKRIKSDDLVKPNKVRKLRKRKPKK